MDQVLPINTSMFVVCCGLAVYSTELCRDDATTADDDLDDDCNSSTCQLLDIDILIITSVQQLKACNDE